MQRPASVCLGIHVGDQRYRTHVPADPESFDHAIGMIASQLQCSPHQVNLYKGNVPFSVEVWITACRNQDLHFCLTDKPAQTAAINNFVKCAQVIAATTPWPRECKYDAAWQGDRYGLCRTCGSHESWQLAIAAICTHACNQAVKITTSSQQCDGPPSTTHTPIRATLVFDRSVACEVELPNEQCVSMIVQQIQLMCPGVIGVQIRKQHESQDEHSSRVTVDIRGGLRGGGKFQQGQQPGPSAAPVLRAKGKLASVLIGRGATSKDTLQLVDSLEQHVSRQDLLEVANIDGDDEALKAIGKIAADLPLSIRQLMPGSEAAAKKIQQGFRKISKKQATSDLAARSKRANIVRDLSQFRFDDNLFEDVEGNPLPLYPSLELKKQGVSLCTAEEILPFIARSGLLSSDHCTVLTTSNVPVQAPIESEKWTIPACDQDGQPVLIAAFAIHLGEKHAKLKTMKNATVHVTPSQIVVLKAHSDTMSATQWSQAIHKPGNFLLTNFGDQLDKKITDLWGRLYTLQGRKCSPETADCVQITIRISQDKVSQCLQRSGLQTPPVFANLKIQPGEAQDHAIVWAGKAIQHALGTATTAPWNTKHHGLVRAGGGYGIRVRVGDYEALYADVHPDAPPTPYIRTDNRFTIDGLPEGINASQIGSWAHDIGWKCKALRKITAKKWIVGSPEANPPLCHVAFNGVPVVIQPANDPKVRGMTQATVVAGSRKWISAQSSTDHKNDAVDILQQADPWASALRNQGTTTSASTRVHTGTGPTSQTLQAQDQKIEKIENQLAAAMQQLQAVQTEMQQEKDRNQNNHTEIKTQLDQNSAASITLAGEITKLQQQTREAITQSHQNFDVTLKNALEAQNSQLMANFQAMLQSKEPHEPQHKTPRTS